MTTLDRVMDALGYLQVALFLVWVALDGAAELAHSWKSKTARSLLNFYAVGLWLSIIGLFYVFVVCAETPETPLSQVVINRGILYMALCLVFTHTCVRGMSLVLDLFGVSNHHYLRIGCAKCAKTPLRQFLTFFFVMGALFVWTVLPYLLLWIMGEAH